MKVYCTIREAAARSGLSQYLWRQLVRHGTVPAIRSGTKYLINYPAAMCVLDNLSGTRYPREEAK